MGGCDICTEEKLLCLSYDSEKTLFFFILLRVKNLSTDLYKTGLIHVFLQSDIKFDPQ